MNYFFRLIILSTVFLTPLLFAASETEEAVPGYFEHYLIGKKLNLCTMDNVEELGKTKDGFRKVQRWSRKAAYRDLKKRFSGFTIDYNVKVDSVSQVLDGEKLLREEDKALYASTLQFEMTFNPAVKEYVGFARYLNSTKNEKPNDTLGKAFAVRMKVAGGLDITAWEVVPRVRADLKDRLAIMAWTESLHWDDGVMFRNWVETDYQVDVKTFLKDGESINTSTSTDSSFDCE